MTRHWISCARFTVEVETDTRGMITRAAPIVRKFQGQPIGNLLNWARELGGFRHEVLSETQKKEGEPSK
jgi:hypothetical protein